jgi:hypothetical protein
MEGKFGKQEDVLKSIIIDSEYETAKTNSNTETTSFEDLIDMIECKRTKKDYDWMSDIFIPEFPTISLTDASDWANQYFQTRDFVEVKLENTNPEDKRKCEAAKRIINKTLNNREIYHYHKYIRARHINSLYGQVYILCWWDKKVNQKLIGNKIVEKIGDTDIMGNPLVNPAVQEPMITQEEQPEYSKQIIYDRFNYDVIDPRNVFTDNKYSYSVQDKDWIIIRSEKTYFDLITNEASNGYFNLDKVKDIVENVEDTESSKVSTETQKRKPDKTPLKYLDILERYGKFPCVVKERNEDGYPTLVSPGYDDEGKILDDTELLECIITFAKSEGRSVLIRFQPTPFVDSRGNTYKPLVRGWCYIHPTKDTGLSDGKYSSELQKAINDTFNMNSDRTKLATLPTLKGRSLSLMDNDTVYFAPEHVIELENPEDLVEFKISDNIEGGLAQIAMLTTAMNKVTARPPESAGQLPQDSSVSATASNNTMQRTSLRNNYKSLTIEFTMLLEMYWIILQMADEFMEKETAQLILGEYEKDFDPNPDYTYSPVTQSIEVEQSKQRKLQLIDQFVGRLVNFPNPKTPALLNYMMTKAFELFGDEFPEFKDVMFDESVDPSQAQGGGQGGNQVANMPSQPSSNQKGTPMSPMEIETRNSASSGNIRG